MAATPIIIGQAQRDALAALRNKAAAAPIDMPPVLKQLETEAGKAAHFKRMAALTIDIPAAFAVTFSIETNHPGGTMRHMSMSSHRHGRMPIPEGVWMVAEELGFVGGLEACRVWKEDIGDGDIAINVVQPVRVTAA
jgi:hypothetical protein